MATLFTFDANGIKFVDFQNLRATIENLWTQTFGVELDYSPTTPDGHHIDLECRVIRSVSELLQEILANFNRTTAKGVYLDFLAAFVGITRNEGESDASFRDRVNSANVDGFAVIDGMITHLRDAIDNRVAVAENDEDKVVDGLAPHSFRVTVPTDYKYNLNGTEYDLTTDVCKNHIAQEIWRCKPAGIKSSGNSYGTAIDKAHKSHDMHFSIPSDVDIDIKVSAIFYKEETLPTSWRDDVKAAIVAWAYNEYIPGRDVIPQRILVPLFSVPGIAGANIQVRVNGSSTWQDDSIAISPEQTAVVVAENITVE